jgi:hypothetical protein
MKPCKFDHNGECLICDSWPDNCAYDRLMNRDYQYESYQELIDMLDEHLSDEERQHALTESEPLSDPEFAPFFENVSTRYFEELEYICRLEKILTQLRNKEITFDELPLEDQKLVMDDVYDSLAETTNEDISRFKEIINHMSENEICADLIESGHDFEEPKHVDRLSEIYYKLHSKQISFHELSHED